MTFRIVVTFMLAIWPTIAFAAGARCPEEAGLRSIRGDSPTSITFINRLPIAVRIYWINYQGRRQYYGTVRPHKSYHQQTFLTHPWVVTDRNEDCIAVYMPPANPGQVIVAGSAHHTEPSSVMAEGTLLGKWAGAGNETANVRADPARPGHFLAEIRVTSNQCAGDVEVSGQLGDVAIATAKRPPEGGAVCRVELRLMGPNRLRVSEVDNCTDFHGFRCSFTGNLTRRGVTRGSDREGRVVAANDLDVPVVEEGGDGQAANCSSSIVLAPKDKNGDPLAVRSGPGQEYRKIDKLHPGEIVFVFNGSGDWAAIVYRTDDVRCSSRKTHAVTYKKKGWVRMKYLKNYAG